MVEAKIRLEAAGRAADDPVGTGYAVWTGIGAVGTAIVGILALGEPRDAGRLIALITIIGGIIGLKLTSPA